MGRLAFFCALLLLLSAPWLRGGNRQVALVLLLTLALLFFAAVLGNWSFSRVEATLGLGRTRARPAAEAGARATPGFSLATARTGLFWAMLMLLVSSPLWVAALQMVTLAPVDWSALPGRGAYLAGLAAMGGAQQGSAYPMSLIPSGTAASLWAGVPVAAALLAGALASARQAWVVFGVVLAIAAVQVLVALIQYVQGPTSILFFDSQFAGYGLIGTFNNRNHVADLFAMAIPLWFALLGRWRRDSDEPRAKLALFVVPLWYLLGFAVLVLLLATQSRGGLLAALVALCLSLVLHVQTSEALLVWRHWLGLGLFVVLFALIAVLAVGEDRVTERFAQTVLLAHAEVRNLLARSTFDAALAFWPWGSGAGSFEPVFPRFQSALSPGYTGFAHNDYVQLLMEFGAVAVLLAGALLVLVLVQLWRLGAAARRHGAGHAALRQQWFAGVGALAMLLHSWVEFNMHIPAIAITAAMLMGIFLRPVDDQPGRG